MDAIISFLRNGACVFRDLLPEHAVATYKLPVEVKFLGDVPLLDLFVGVLQLVPVYGGLDGFKDFWRAAATLRRAYSWKAFVDAALAKRNTRELREVRRRVAERIWNGWGLVLDGLLKVVVGVGFFCLFLMSLKVFRGDETGVVLSLIAMEFVLGAFLLKATFNLASKWATARRLAASEREALEAAEECPALLDMCAKGGSLGLHVQDEGCFCLPALLTADAASVRKTFTQLKALATSSKADTRMDALEVLHRAEQAGLKGLDESLVEGAIFLLDVVAFWGYMVYPLDYFFPDEALYHKLIPGFPGKAAFLWWGNLVGDVCWTIQPLVILSIARIHAYLQSQHAPRHKMPKRPSPEKPRRSQPRRKVKHA